MRWWPFGQRKLEAPLNSAQKAQIEESVTRIKVESDERVERAKSTLEEAAAAAVKAVDRRQQETYVLRTALRTLIDRQTHGRFDMQQNPGRGR